jgi:formate hydrogenlyase subunit 6/NADH:ubiquinone oxidoreductase subunit I
MRRPGKILREVFRHVLGKPATKDYPFNKEAMPKGFRGRLLFHMEKCIGCKMCVRDCPAGALDIVKIGEKLFECRLDLGKCIYCAQCVDSCLKKAIEYTGQFELAQTDREKLKMVFKPEIKNVETTQDPAPETPKS